MKFSNYCSSINYADLGNATRAAVFALLLGAALPLSAQTAAQGKTVQTFLIYYGGGPTLVASDAAKLAKFDLLDFDRFRYNQIDSNTWAAVKADIVDQPWVADGIFADNCVAFPAQVGYSATSVKYPTDAAFSAGMNSFVSAIATGLHGYGQKLWCNKGETRSVGGSAAWLSLDASANPPDVFLHEGAFSVLLGGLAVQHPQVLDWQHQIRLVAA